MDRHYYTKYNYLMNFTNVTNMPTKKYMIFQDLNPQLNKPIVHHTT